jgi:hypothetical protein
MRHLPSSYLYAPLFKKPLELLSNLLTVSLAAQISTTPIIATSFSEVSIIEVLTNLVAVSPSGPILTLGLLGTLAGDVAASLAYLVNACSGFPAGVLACSVKPRPRSRTPSSRLRGRRCPLSGSFSWVPARRHHLGRPARRVLAEGGWPLASLGGAPDHPHRRVLLE